MRKKILIIDDDQTICEIIDMLLTEEGYDVEYLLNGDMIEQKITSFNPDLFILDYLMPGKSGAEITQFLRAQPSTKNKPVIMIAANSHYKNHAKKAGVNLFLNKPFDIYELIYAVKTLIENTSH